MATPAYCVNCSSFQHHTTQCPLPIRPLDSIGRLAGGFGGTSPSLFTDDNTSTLLASAGASPSPGHHLVNQSPHSSGQQVSVLVQRTFQYPGAPKIPLFHQYPSPELLNEDLFKWGQSMEVWAKGFQSFSIQLSEVLELDASPGFNIDPQGFSVTIRLPDNSQSQAALDLAINKANRIINQSIPSYGFSTSTPINLQMHSGSSHQFPQNLMSPQGSTSPALAVREELQATDDSPTPRGKGRGGASTRGRGRGGSSAKEKVAKPRKTAAAKATTTPKKPAATPKKTAATPRKRAPPKKKAPKKEPAAAEDAADGDAENIIEGGQGLAVNAFVENATTADVGLGIAVQHEQTQETEQIKQVKSTESREKVNEIDGVEFPEDNFERALAAQLGEA